MILHYINCARYHKVVVYLQLNQFNQTYGYSLSGQGGQAPIAQAFTQPSLFLQPGPSQQNELYSSNPYRSQFGQSQQSAIMPSTSSSHLSSTIKQMPSQMPSQNQFIGIQSGLQSSSGKNNLPLQYGQLVNSTSLPPSGGVFVQYDPQPVNNQNTVNSSQIIGSHLVQQRAAVQPQSSFYSQPTGAPQSLGQAGFFQQGTSNLQVCWYRVSQQ